MALRIASALVMLFTLLISDLGGSAAFYGGGDASGTMGGACGYGNLYTDGYGVKNAALSTALFNSGASCGSCYQIVCDAAKDPQWCKRGTYITITAKISARRTTIAPSNNGGCRESISTCLSLLGRPSPYTAEELSPCITEGGIPATIKLEDSGREIHWVRCGRTGGVRFTINGRNYFELVLVTNVGGSGVVSAMWIKGSNTDWQTMSRNWGMNWQSFSYLNGQSLSFRVQTDDGRVKTFYNVAPSNWQFGQTFSTSYQF
ncbi:uncharacterized protein A4U43_C07F10410 [Asparagus officinalis]|uniref:Expansin n=1 Tax=Asparagus officinalis TaxID=4686 RepID=A0A5P1EAT4_ASPOF|nr:uncharacterized protein A4U43_C07F10410 [Asparagus officinalis]